ncbi:sulfate adenylyltransferase subunit CysN [Sandarakinorhabdus sp.]|uniref:sulfate adenylyltransferase subunit CysN n=1 Tax=Sandarakinorhabdus sp. TaxID=1916663 RepID=UPI003341A05E
MAEQDTLIVEPDTLIAASERRQLLRFITCGSVDDGKSTLIGRLLHDSGMIPVDQLAALAVDSRRLGTQGAELDFALLVDGLAAEREQGITIDVAYRFFHTQARSFIVADCPGHEQYTRNMITGASTADLAVLVVDARGGLLAQTRRHAFLCQLVGVRSMILAVNKMDLVDHSQAVFERIAADFCEFAGRIGVSLLGAVPISGLRGDNVFAASTNMAWYDGPTLLTLLESAQPGADLAAAALRLPVQWVNRPNQDFRGFAGLIASGTVRPGDAVRLAPSGRTSQVSRIVTMDGDLDAAVAGQSVTLCLADEIDCSRGDVIAAAGAMPGTANQFEATIVWMDEAPLKVGRGYWLKLATQVVSATVQQPKYVLNVETLDHLAARTLALNAIGVAELATDRPLVFEPYATNRTLGGFVLIDKLSHHTVAAGMINFGLRRAQNVQWQALEVTREARAAQKQQRAAVLWFTGLSGSGKSTIANLVEKRLLALGMHSFLLDGDNLRHGLNRDLGFTEADRIENVRRVGEVARLMTDAGLVVITALISPFQADRDTVRAMMPAGEFVEVHIDTPLAEAERRDVKGLYAKARAGQIANFTGIDSPYEAPAGPEIRIDTMRTSPEAAAEQIVDYLLSRPAG